MTSHGNDVDVEIRRRRERFQAMRIGRQQRISVGCEQHEGGVNDVGSPGSSEQHTGPPPQRGVKRGDIECRQQPRKVGLTSRATSPHLAHDAAMRERRASGQQLLLDQRDGVAIGPLDREERAGIQYQTHPAFLRVAGLRRAGIPRTVIALARARRPAR